MGIELSKGDLLQGLTKSLPAITTLCSHSSLQIFHGAKLEGFPTIGLAQNQPPRFYEAFPLGRPDKFLTVKKFSDVDEVVPELQRSNAVIIPTGSFVEYVGPEKFNALPIPVFGNRKVMEWESDREKEREWLEKANVPMPKKYRDPHEVDGPVIIKYYGAKGGKGFYLAKNREELMSYPIRAPHVVQEYIVGTRYYIHFFYSPISKEGYRVGSGSLELLGIDRRDEANIDELYKLGSQEELNRSGIRPTFVVTGNVPVVLRESLLPNVFEVAERIIKTSIELFGGMVGPFCVEGIMTENLEFKVFEISTRIVAGTNLFINGSPYSDLVSPGLSTGRRIAMEIKQGIREGRLKEILS
jgi:5-formaminoimidazole-4-carboxamide-1-(beta)-D-ribofuranosyl 5'-monophosphate synthetase